MIYCFHATSLNAIKLGYTEGSNPAPNAYAYARKHKLSYDKHSLLMFDCPQYVEHVDMEKDCGHLLLEQAGLTRMPNRELFLLGDYEYYQVAYCVMQACRCKLWHMTERDPAPLLKRVVDIKGAAPNRQFVNCPEFPRQISGQLKRRFAIAESLVEAVLYVAWHAAMVSARDDRANLP